MRALTWATLWSLPSRPRSRILCYTTPKRLTTDSRQHGLHTSISKCSPTAEPTNDGSARMHDPGVPNTTESADLGAHMERFPPDGSGNGSSTPRPKDPNNYGSASNRARRNRIPKEFPPVHIPEWFLERNVTLFEDVSDEIYSSTLGRNSHGRSPDQKGSEISSEDKDGDPSSTQAETPSSVKSKPALDVHPPLLHCLNTPEMVRKEVRRMLSGMTASPSAHYADALTNIKSHMLVYCPKAGASNYLVALIKESSMLLNRFHNLRLDAQDIAEIGGRYMEDSGTSEPNALSSLGYDVYLAAAHRQAQGAEPPEHDEDLEENEEDEHREDFSAPSSSRSMPRTVGRRESINVGMGIIPLGSMIGNFQEAFRFLGNNEPTGRPPSSKPYTIDVPQETKDNTDDLKMGLLVETLLNTPEKKMKAKGYLRVASRPDLRENQHDLEPDTGNHPEPMDTLRPFSKNLLITIEDYPQINSTVSGSKFLDKLHDVVDTKRNEGQRIVIIGTASTRDMMPNFSKSSVQELQAGPSHGPMRTIVIPVSEEPTHRHLLIREQRNKIRGINLRHLRGMLRRLASEIGQVSSIVDHWNLEIDSKIAFLADLDDYIWSVDRVNRVATYALGASYSDPLRIRDIEHAFAAIYATDHAKYTWIRKERANENQTDKKPKKRERDAEERIKELRMKCNSHEKKLLHGVVDADTIRTTFADVQAPSETIEALKTLTSLSLLRPDAFTYGVLATDRIPGLLLYGPPGTGKTLLAKAVAKESGATVLEVSGSDVYDMYVGEGEKNVRAIFSLAKKLAPCIIFVDEADAILGSRGGSSNRTSHRELINQFLREWDGLTDLNAFIMVATNRPFDLDEASLRRLPRRLLVDLPIEKDREAILRIHLKNETLDPEVSLSKLASETPFYSGSDLKNLCVAAALACVREEFDTAAEHNINLTKDTPDFEKYRYAEKRTLCERHFTKGMDEISASISEDMGSLSAIRKFDEKYGDRRGRRKKLGAYGFKTVEDSEIKGSDAARVRNQ